MASFFAGAAMLPVPRDRLRFEVLPDVELMHKDAQVESASTGAATLPVPRD